jgi:hypothetical protein
MQISLQRSGGFTGVPTTTTIDTATLAPDAAEQLRQILASIDFSQALIDLTPDHPVSMNLPDRFRYHLTLEDTNGQSQTLSFDESTMPSTMQPLIDWLRQTAQ